MIRYLGVLDGGNLATGNIRDRSHVLTFEALGNARAALREADAGSGQIYSALQLDGSRPLPIPGGIGEDAQLTLWRIAPVYSEDVLMEWRLIANDPDPYPDFILTLGPRGGVKLERL